MADPISDYFVSDASRLVGEVYKLMRVTGRMSALVMKGEAPEGMGFNFQTVLWDRSTAGSQAVWSPILGSGVSSLGNDCDLNPLVCNPANTIYNYNMIQTRLKSNELCMSDVRAGYQFEEQVMAIRDNFKALIVDVWEDQDKLAFFQLPGHKIVVNSAMTDYYGQSDFGSALPTSRMTGGTLRYLYQLLVRDAAGEEPVAYRDAAPLFTMLLGPEAQQDIIQNDPSVRQDIRYAQMGEGSDAWLLQTWNVDRDYAGFLLTVDVKMPRWTFNYATGQYVSVPYYISVPATNGSMLIPNPAYLNAPYEDAYIWMKQTYRRDMPKPFGSGGADARFNPVNMNGEVYWKNTLTFDNTNPLGLKGLWWSQLSAAYKPIKPSYAYVVRHLICSVNYLLSCY
jgi:hypothetical protein